MFAGNNGAISLFVRAENGATHIEQIERKVAEDLAKQFLAIKGNPSLNNRIGPANG